MLDDAEVLSTTYVCAGQDGQNGSAGENGQNGSDAANLLVRVDVEPAGSNCPSGGEAILVGADTNGDGVLQDAEVEDTAYLCGPLPAPTVIDGDYVIANSLDVAALAGVTEITGNVQVTSTTLTSLSLPNLQHVGSFSVVYTTPLSSLSMPALVSVGSAPNFGVLDIEAPLLLALDLSSLATGTVLLMGDRLTAISFPAFQTGRITINGTAATSLSTTLQRGLLTVSNSGNLTSISVDGLTHGAVSVSNTPALQALDLPALVDDGGYNGYGGAIYAQVEAHLTSISAPNLLRGHVVITGVPAFTTLDLPSLQFGTIQVSDAPLTALSLPALTSAPGIALSNDANLTSISAPNLVSTSSFTVQSDPQLPTCMAQALAAQCGATNVTISGTDDSATCP